MNQSHTIPYVSATMRRDASSTCLAYVPAHELGILRHIFGAENVEHELMSPAMMLESTAAKEAERLSRKYDHEQVSAVFGPSLAGLDEAMRQASTAASTEQTSRTRRKFDHPDA